MIPSNLKKYIDEKVALRNFLSNWSRTHGEWAMLVEPNIHAGRCGEVLLGPHNELYCRLIDGKVVPMKSDTEGVPVPHPSTWFKPGIRVMITWLPRSAPHNGFKIVVGSIGYLEEPPWHTRYKPHIF